MYLVTFMLLCLSSKGSKEVLRHVHVFYRHGDRASLHHLHDKHDKNNIWRVGLGQLTDIGIIQQFALGQWLRIRYKYFLSTSYVPSEIYVRSTDVDRTLMSAQSNLAGLYNSNRNPTVNCINLRPIPVHTVPKPLDTFLLPFQCQAFTKKLKESYNSENYRTISKTFDRTLDIMRDFLNRKIFKLEDVWLVYDTLFCEKTHNKTWPPWVTEDIYGNISKIYHIHWKMIFDGDELARLAGGRLLHEIITKMIEMVETGILYPEKMRIYSVHDITVAALLSAIRINDGIPPAYASCLMIELFHRPKNDSDSFMNWIVKIVYKRKSNDLTVDLPEIAIKGCNNQPCTLREFIKNSKSRILNIIDHQNLCYSSVFRIMNSNISLILLMIVLAIFS